MTVATTVNRESFNGDGVTVTFDFTFKAFVDTDIKVMVRDAGGTETLLILDTDYTAVVNAGAGGTVTLIGAYAATPPATGEKVTIYRDIPYTQQIDPIENDPQRADVQEEGFDRAVILAQQLKDMMARSIQLPVSTAFANLSLPEPQAEKYLRWNALGNALENITLTGSLVALSPYMETLIGAIDAAAARGTLGVYSTAEVTAAINAAVLAAKQEIEAKAYFFANQ